MSRTKILHFADIQVEARNRQQRAFEYRAAFDHLLETIAKEDVQVIAFTGDGFEFPQPNDVERQLWIDFLHAIPDHIEVVMMDGNHDLIQKNNHYVVDGFHSESSPSPISTLVKSINKSNVRYFSESTFYASQVMEDVWFAVWAHNKKYDINYSGRYSPYEQDPDLHKTVKEAGARIIDLYHDPISVAKNWDGNIVHGAAKHVGLDAFGELCLAGDIHCPTILTSKSGKMFTYCSSLIIRDFGEGDYYDGLKLYQHGNDKHGYNIVDVETENADNDSIEFRRFQPPVTYNTIRFTNSRNSFSYTEESFDLLDVFHRGSEFTRIRLVVEANHLKFAESEKRIREVLRRKVPNAVIEPTVWGKDLLISDQIDATIDSIKIDRGQLVSNDEILTIADSYIERRINATRSIAKEDKDEVIKDLKSLMRDELSNIDRENRVKALAIMSFEASNFMSFGDNVRINFYEPDSGALVRITGANKVGKTTLMHFVNWMLTDQISFSQTPKYKRDNYLAFFNDSRFDTDTVIGDLIINLNDVNYRIKKTLTRHWNPDADKDPEHWKNQVKGVPEMNISIEALDGSLSITNTNDAIDWLILNVGTFYDLSRLMFVNYQNLHDLINNPSAQLNDQILYNLGLNFFDALMERYELIRADRMSKVYRPDESIEQCLQKIDESRSKIDDLNLKKDANEKNLSELEELLKKQDELIESERQKLHNVPFTKEQAENGIKALETAIEQAQNDSRNDEATIQSNDLKIIELRELEPKLVDNEAKLSEASQARNALSNQVDQLTSANDLLKSQIKTRGLEIEKDNNKLISDLKDDRIKQTDRLNEIKLSINEIKSNMDRQISDARARHEKNRTLAKESATAKINDLKAEIAKLDNQERSTKLSIQSCEEDIKRHEDADTCPTCKRKMDDETIDQIKSIIETRNKEIASLRAGLEEDAAQRNKINESIQSEAASIQSILTDISKAEEAEIKMINEECQTGELKLVADRGQIELEIESIDKSIADNTAKLTELMRTDEIIKVHLAEIESNTKQIETIRTSIQEQDLLIKMIQEAVSNIKDQLKQISTLSTANSNLKIAITERLGKIENHRIKIDDLKLKLEQLESNEKIQKEIDELTRTRSYYVSEIKEAQDQLSNFENLLNGHNESIKQSNDKIEMHVKYRRTDSSLRIYKQLIGKDGLVAAVFQSIVSVLNKKLNDLLESVNFRLFFDPTGQLKMIDYSKPSKAIRSVTFSSGMESTFLGLSLLYVLKELNATKQFSPLFIDEISGKLNDGENLSYEAVNYQEEFKVLLHKIRQSVPIYIVDHVIDDLGEDDVVEVVPGENGSRLVNVPGRTLNQSVA